MTNRKSPSHTAPALPRRKPANPRTDDAPARSGGPPLSHRAYELIKERILSMQLRPGQFLNEAALCKLTGIGRMPVHQATHRLRAEGLIEIIPRKGLVIRMDSLHDILELLEARITIEPQVAALAAERISKEHCVKLERLLKQSRSLLQQSKRQAHGVIDRAFHRLVVEAASNHVLADALRPLHERSELFWRLTIMPEEALEVTQREHEAVLHAILKHDAESAREAMQAHLRSLHNRILKATNARR